ncbi:MAG TPA: hypothetical protein PKA61_10140 [Nitrospira sp.]|nr:hypothetical protein [Nitrospira sp.]
MTVSPEKATESFLLFGLQAQETNSDLTFFDPANNGEIDTDGQIFIGRGQDQLQIAGRLNPGSGIDATASGG